MYSVVLMMAMTSGAETPDCGLRHSCHGGCNGGWYAGCHGGGYGGCYGGCTGSAYVGGCYGGGCYGGGCYGGGCYGGGCYGVSPYNATPTMSVPPRDMPKPPAEEIKKPPKGDKSAAPAPATFIVTLPADAKLTVDGAPTSSTSTERSFLSPDLPPGRNYQYTLRAVVTRDGKPVSIEKIITVQAGKESHVTMNLPSGVAAK